MTNVTSISSKIKSYSDAISSIFLNDYKQLIDEKFSNLSSKQMILLELLKEKSKTINDIADSFSITASAVSQLVSKLEKMGYVKREINLENRREIIVSLDELGKQFNNMLSEIDLYLINKYYARLEKEDLEKLLDLYEKLYKIALEVQNED